MEETVMSKIEKLKKTYGEDLLWSGKKCICGLPISFTRYILTRTVLYTRTGFLNVKEDEVELYKIVDSGLRHHKAQLQGRGHPRKAP